MTELLRSTLAFEAVVDAVINFHVATGELGSRTIAPQLREQYRRQVLQALNDRNEFQRMRAENAAADVLVERLGSESRYGIRLGVNAAICTYREHLQNAPVQGVGQLR